MKVINQICISRLDKMGDMILSLPIIKAIKVSYLGAVFTNIFSIRKLNFDFFLNLSPTSLSYFFCFFSNSKNKATLIFLSRYKKSTYSKILIQLFSKIFCRYVHIIDRYSKLRNNENIHQTKMIFDLIKICHIPFDSSATIDFSLPQNCQ